MSAPQVRTGNSGPPMTLDGSDEQEREWRHGEPGFCQWQGENSFATPCWMKPNSIFDRPVFRSLMAVIAMLQGSAVMADEWPYKMILKSDVEMDIGGKKQAIAANTELNYTWKHEGLKQELSFDSMSVVAVNNGKEMMNTQMSKDRFSLTKEGEKPVEILVADASAELKATLNDGFGTAVYTRHFDESGAQVSTQTTARPGASDLVENGIIANGLLFHPLRAAAGDSWQTDGQMSMGNGGYAKGKLTYKKVAGKPGTKYAVSGVLTNAHHQKEGTPVAMDNVKYVVTGEQSYDEASKSWASGKFKIEVKFELNAANKLVGKAEGVMQASMERRE